MRAGAWAIGTGLLTLAGCAADPAGAPPVNPTPVVRDLPAYSAGGACQLLDFSVVADTIGVRFDIAGATHVRTTRSCVLRTKDEPLPDLAVSITKTSADASVFEETVVPRGGRSVRGLGRAAYRASSAPATGRPAAAEVGWLSRDGQLVTLRYSCAPDEETAAADAIAAKLVDLAKKIDAGLRPASAAPARSSRGAA